MIEDTENKNPHHTIDMDAVEELQPLNDSTEDETEKPISPHHAIQIDEVEEFKPEDDEVAIDNNPDEPDDKGKEDQDANPQQNVEELQDVEDVDLDDGDDVKPTVDDEVPECSTEPVDVKSPSCDILVENLEIYGPSTDLNNTTPTPNTSTETAATDEVADESRFMMMLVTWLCMCEANLPPDSFLHLMKVPTLQTLLSVISLEQQLLVRKMFTNRIGDDKVPNNWDHDVKKVLKKYDKRKESIDESMIMEGAFD